jgi:hypothetical protein
MIPKSERRFSRLREAVQAACLLVSRFGGRRQVGKIMLKQQIKAELKLKSFRFSGCAGA